jgi:hypothetical protein
MQVAVSRAVTTCSVSRVCSRIPGGAAAARRNPTSMCPAVSAMSCFLRYRLGRKPADRRKRAAGDMRAEPGLYIKRGGHGFRGCFTLPLDHSLPAGI